MTDQKEHIRVDNIYLSAGKKYKKNPETEKNTKILFNIISKANNKMFINSKDHCKAENEELSKYAVIKKEGLDIKPNVDVNLLYKSSEKFQLCVEDANKEIVSQLNKYNKDFSGISDDLKDCLDNTAKDSKAKSDDEIESEMYECFRKFEFNHLKLSGKYIDTLNKLDI